jgi:Helix-turn-helix domain
MNEQLEELIDVKEAARIFGVSADTIYKLARTGALPCVKMAICFALIDGLWPSGYVLDLSDLGKYLISWHSQRPNMAYSEARIFDKYFEQLFKREYGPENAQALNFWQQAILTGWTAANPFGLNESLLAMRTYAPFHQLYAVSMCFAISNGQSDRVPSPHRCYEKAKASGLLEQIVEIAATCLNTVLESAANEQQPQGRVFSPQNWIKAKTCLSAINQAIRGYFSMLPTLPGGKEQIKRLKDGMTLISEDFEYRWAAD